MAEKIFIPRTRIVVQRQLQFRFARFVILYSILTAIITGSIVFYTTLSILGTKLSLVYPSGRLIEIFQSVYSAFAVTLVVIIPFVFYLAVLYSHRIFGPMPKIYDALRAIGKGDFEHRVFLRKTDHLRELADTINEMADGLRKRNQDLKL